MANEIGSLEAVDKTAAEMMDKLKRLQREIDKAEPWEKDAEVANQTFAVRNFKSVSSYRGLSTLFTQWNPLA